jgi:hypothetical protein
VKPMCHKIIRRHARSECGVLLIECLVYIGLLFVVLNLAYAAYNRCSDNSKRLSEKIDDVVRTLQAGEIWRDDIRAATNVDSVEGSLRLAQSNTTVEYAFEDDTVWRRAKADAQWAQFLPVVKLSRMERDSRKEVTAWRWNVELFSDDPRNRMPLLFTFEAVPHGPQTK